MHPTHTPKRSAARPLELSTLCWVRCALLATSALCALVALAVPGLVSDACWIGSGHSLLTLLYVLVSSEDLGWSRDSGEILRRSP